MQTCRIGPQRPGERPLKETLLKPCSQQQAPRHVARVSPRRPPALIPITPALYHRSLVIVGRVLLLRSSVLGSGQCLESSPREVIPEEEGTRRGGASHPRSPAGGRHRPQVRRAGTASHLPAERALSPPPSRLRPGSGLPFLTRPHLEPHPGAGRRRRRAAPGETWPGGSAGLWRGPAARARRSEAMARSPSGRCTLLLLLQLLAVVSAVTSAP